MSDNPVVVMTGSGKGKTILAVAAFVVVLAAIAGCGYFLKGLLDENRRLHSEIVQFKALTETLVRSSTEWATKADVDKRVKELLSKDDLKAVKDDLKALGASLTAVGRTMGSIRRKVSALEKSDREGPRNQEVVQCADGRLIDVHGYTKAPQIKRLEDANKAPVAKVEFNAAESKPWKYTVFERSHRLTTVIGRKDSGQLTFHHVLKYSVPGESDKTFPVKLTASEYLQIPRSRQMFWWTPALDVGVFAGGRAYGIGGDAGEAFSFGVDLGFSFSSYGRTKADSLLRLFRLGGGYDAQKGAAHFSFSPVQVNIGDPLPLLTNLWLWPYVGLDTAGGLNVGGSVGLRL